MNFTEEARKIAISLGRDYPDVIERIAAALAAAHERGRQEGNKRPLTKCAICDDIHDNDGMTDICRCCETRIGEEVDSLFIMKDQP